MLKVDMSVLQERMQKNEEKLIVYQLIYAESSLKTGILRMSCLILVFCVAWWSIVSFLLPGIRIKENPSRESMLFSEGAGSGAGGGRRRLVPMNPASISILSISDKRCRENGSR